MFNRNLQAVMENNFDKQKVALLLGARRVGKTEMMQAMYLKRKQITLWLNGEDADTASLLENRTESNYRKLLEGYNLLFIDEAQFIPDIAQKVKLMIDTIHPLHVILTGSSAFDLTLMSGPLEGRTIIYNLYPLAQKEWKQSENLLQTEHNLEERLIYGSYPELSSINTSNQKAAYLRELINAYLLNYFLKFLQIKNSKKLKDLLVLIAYQVGNEVSPYLLGQQLGMSKNTVEKYLDLLSKVFVIYSRSGYSNNLRKEVVKSKRWYFMDNGIRNGLINDFRPLSVRNDIGALWEQYILAERIKYNSYNQNAVESYFWRTYDQQEIDLIEVKDTELLAIECKWKKESAKIPTAFAKAYPEAQFEVINQGNYLEWIGG